MDLREEPAISNWKRPCFRRQNGSEFPELAAQNFRNPQAQIRGFKLESGEVIRDCAIGYRGFGTLNPGGSNAVLFHSLWLEIGWAGNPQ